AFTDLQIMEWHDYKHLDWISVRINLEYLRGGTSSRKYTTSVTKTKAADYGHIKWFEDLVPRTMWIHKPINYVKHALWGVSHWGRKLIDLKIVEWHNYKHLDWISVRRDDDKIYKFKEGDFKRLRLQEIKDMMLLLVQGKLSNLTVEERFAFNVSLRMFTRSIVIQRRVKDLQLGVKSYQKRLNLTKPDTYRSDLKRREAYTAYSPKRIYLSKQGQEKGIYLSKQEAYTAYSLNDVRNALDDHLKGIRMQYLPKTIWRKGDKDRAAAMIQAIDKMLKTRRIMRSLERFVGRRLVDTLTPELLAGPTYELMKGSCNSLTELEYHLEEVYKATMDQLDWVNPEGQQYPHNLLQPLPLIPDNRGRHVIPFAHFINNDLEYLRGGAFSRKYTTSVTKTKAADYGHIKWIEDLFYGFAVNRESALDVYSKRRIIAITDLKIVEWHSYKHLDWTSVRRDDEKIYKFKECDFKRLRLQDIEDMLLLLVQGKLSNMTVEERFAFNVSLRMFTRSIVIQRLVEDLQLGVESYQKRLNLTKPDTYRSDLKRREAYTAYSNPRGFIYQNKDKKNRLMRIDELHKFSDGTLNDVRNALDDRLKGIRMHYLPQTIWRKGDKDRATAMIQAIDKMLKTKRIMRSLESEQLLANHLRWYETRSMYSLKDVKNVHKRILNELLVSSNDGGELYNIR
nr:hypothetical protein [Tanacetum cinerariifolium]